MRDNKNFLGTEPVGKLLLKAIHSDSDRPAHQHAL